MKTVNKIYGASLLAFMLMIAAPLKNIAQDKVSDTVPVFKKPVQNTQDVLKQKAEQIKGEQKAVRQQRRDERIRTWQEQSVSAPMQPPPIWGRTPLQQQQMALRDQKRQLQWQQQQAQRAQQLQFQKQKQGKKP